MTGSLRGYRYRAYPTRRQQELLEQWQHAYADVWNAALEQRLTYWRRGRRVISAAEQARQLPEARAAHGRLQACPAQVANEAVRRLDAAYQAAYRRLRSGKTPGWPQFLAWRDAPLLFSCDRRSLRSASLDGTPSNTSGTWRLVDERPGWLAIEFAKARGGEPFGRLRVRAHRPLPDRCRVRTLAIRQKAGRWWASITVEAEFAGEPAGTGCVGVNRGVHVAVAVSDGTLIHTDPVYRRYARRIVRLQQRVSRAQRGSRRRRMLVQRLGREWERVAARRRERAYRLAGMLLDRYGTVALEEYDTAGMLEDRPAEDPAAKIRHLHRRIQDAAWADLARIIRQRAEERDATVLVVPADGITVTCSGCGGDITEEAARAVRSRTDRDVSCACGLAVHVDVNAARNVLARATSLAVEA